MSERRVDGVLEVDIFGVLWSVDEPLTLVEVNDCLDSGLVYIIVFIVFMWLWIKGLFEWTRYGCAYVYWVLMLESELVI